MNIKAAIFDMDGTLVDSLMFWDYLWSDLGRKFLSDENFRPSKEDDAAVRTLTFTDAMRLIHNNYKICDTAEQLVDYANGLLGDFYLNKVKLKAGVKEFLDYCYENGTKMCIASATAPEFIKLSLKSCGIEKYFLKLFSCGELGIGKEKPDVFLLAQEFLGEAIDETYVFEDSLVAIKTATKAGFKTVGIYDKYNFGQEEIKKLSTRYISQNENLTVLI